MKLQTVSFYFIYNNGLLFCYCGGVNQDENTRRITINYRVSAAEKDAGILFLLFLELIMISHHLKCM